MKCRTCNRSFTGDKRRRYCRKHTPTKRVRAHAPDGSLPVTPPDPEPDVVAPTTIEQASLAGSAHDELQLMRIRIARTLDDPSCPPRDLAALSRRLIEIGRELTALEARALEDDPVANTQDGKFDPAEV